MYMYIYTMCNPTLTVSLGHLNARYIYSILYHMVYIYQYIGII